MHKAFSDTTEHQSENVRSITIENSSGGQVVNNPIGCCLNFLLINIKHMAALNVIVMLSMNTL